MNSSSSGDHRRRPADRLTLPVAGVSVPNVSEHLPVADGAGRLERGVQQRRCVPLAEDEVVLVEILRSSEIVIEVLVMSTAIRSAADIAEVGWSDPAALEDRMGIDAERLPSSRLRSRSFMPGLSTSPLSWHLDGSRRPF